MMKGPNQQPLSQPLIPHLMTKVLISHPIPYFRSIGPKILKSQMQSIPRFVTNQHLQRIRGVQLFSQSAIDQQLILKSNNF